MAIDLQKLEQKFNALFNDPNFESDFEQWLQARNVSQNSNNVVLAAVLSPLTEKERNERLFLLLDRLIGDKNYEAIGLLRTMVEKDTPAMQKSYQIMTETLVRSNGG